LCDGLSSRQEAMQEVELDIVHDAVGEDIKYRIMKY